MHLRFVNLNTFVRSKGLSLLSVLLFNQIVFFSGISRAVITAKEYYYGPDLISKVHTGQIKNDELLNQLFNLLKSPHIKNANSFDQIVNTCSSSSSCYVHTSLGYDRARLLMFGSIDLERMSDGVYTVKDVYCEKYFTDKDFNSSGNIGPNLLPSNGAILNTEHTWPQSRFTSRFDRNMQKSDLHHLYPSDSEMNSRRGSLRFGHVDKSMDNLKCPQNHLGKQNVDQSTIFEPPVNHRGNVARSLFYFATRYQMKISPVEEANLRLWNKEDPVDAKEIDRNNQIENVQGNRNPFVDYPELVDAIQAFTFKTTAPVR